MKWLCLIDGTWSISLCQTHRNNQTEAFPWIIRVISWRACFPVPSRYWKLHASVLLFLFPVVESSIGWLFPCTPAAIPKDSSKLVFFFNLQSCPLSIRRHWSQSLGVWGLSISSIMQNLDSALFLHNFCIRERLCMSKHNNGMDKSQQAEALLGIWFLGTGTG